MNCTACYYTGMTRAGNVTRKCGNPFESVSEYRLSIDAPTEDTIETLTCRATGRGVEKAMIPLLYGSSEQPGVLRLSVVGNAMVVMGGAWGGGNNDLTSTSPSSLMKLTGATEDLIIGSGDRRTECEAQVTVRGVAGTRVKGRGAQSAFHADTQIKSEQVFFYRRFDIPLPGDRGNQEQQQLQQRRTGTQSPLDVLRNNNNCNYQNNSSARQYSPYPSPRSPTFSSSSSDISTTTDGCDNRGNNGDFLARFIHQLDPIVIDPTWPSSSFHPQGWVRYTVELMTNRTMQFKSVTEIWVHNSPTPSSSSLPSYLSVKDSNIMDESQSADNDGSTGNPPGLLLLDQEHPWNVRLQGIAATQFELGQNIPLRVLSTIQQTTEEQVRLALFQRRSLRTKGVQGVVDTIVQELVDIPLFTPLASLEGVDESRKADDGGDDKEKDGAIVWLQLPSTPVLAPSTRTMYLDIDHYFVLTRVALGSKTKSIVAEVPVTIAAPQRPSGQSPNATVQ
ncbi:hypothetical protein K457DRAFT_14410 [Linnemannia elongata AG-77]|uniref:Uncharacterized protein n=1 Tax=Linnemannia elongata AG-77 TaxID=1314771 RepID=A0A197KAQ7_9FUNG|nr:hypothetical protein K457DRAFT_14410 [Linnemannia elongata AG-77]